MPEQIVIVIGCILGYVCVIEMVSILLVTNGKKNVGKMIDVCSKREIHPFVQESVCSPPLFILSIHFIDYTLLEREIMYVRSPKIHSLPLPKKPSLWLTYFELSKGPASYFSPLS